MKLSKAHVRKLWRAIIEFNMLEPNDRILVGLSGGKDSIFLLYALSVIKKHAPFKFELAALTVDIGFSNHFDTSGLIEFCQKLGVPFYCQTTQIFDIAFAEGGKGACAKCSFFRRGVINKFAKENGFNKVAYAHHNDDAVETFLMSILYSGKVATFKPVTYLDESQVTVIRPLIYFREKEVIAAQRKYTGFVPIPSPCPKEKTSMRAETKELIKMLVKKNPKIYNNIAAAMKEGYEVGRWPREMTKEAIWHKSLQFWGKEVE